MTFSSTVMWPKGLSFWKVRPMPRRLIRSGLSPATTRKSTPRSAWAAERRKTASPKVAKIWASMGASRIQRMSPQ